MQVSPLQVLPVSYVTTIPGDTTLYYVQAILRDTQSSKVLQSINLTNVSSTPNRYVGQFSADVITDASGLGRQIDITISVYTDSGYTTLSNNYQILQLNYTVLQPWIQNLGMGGGMNIDYEKLQKMFDGGRVSNEEIGNEIAARLPKHRVQYNRIKREVEEISEGSRKSLSKEFGDHVEKISKILSTITNIQGEFGESELQRHMALESRIQSLEDRIGEGRAVSSKERLSMKKELISAIKEFREDHKKINDSSIKEGDKKLKIAFSELQEYLEGNMSDRVLSINYPPAPKIKEKKEEISSDEIMALLR